MAEFLSGTDAAVGAAPFVIHSSGTGGLVMSTALGSVPTQPASSLAARVAAARAAEAAAAAANNGAPAPADTPLSVGLLGPAQAQIGKDLQVSITLPSDPRIASAQMTVLYDPAMLTPGASAGRVRQPGWLQVTAGPSSGGASQLQLPFRVSATAPGVAQLSLDGLSLRGSGGENLPAAAAGPISVQIAQ